MSRVNHESGGQIERAEVAAEAAWMHPVEAMEPLPEQSSRDSASLARFFSDLIPGNEHCGGARRQSRAAYHLFCAILYRMSPAFVAGRTGKQMALDLGIQYSTWKKHIERADAHLMRLGIRSAR